MRKATAIVVLALTLVPAAAAAEGAAESRCTAGQQGCTIYDDFDDENVDGTAGAPGIDRISTGRRGPLQSIFTVRTSFVRELVKSVEDI